VVEGEDTPLYNLLSILGEEKSSDSRQSEKFIVVKAQDQQVGLIVDRVDRVVTVDSDRIEPLSPIFKGPARSCFPRVLKHEDKLVLLLAPEGIVNIAQETQKPTNLRDGLDSIKQDEARSEARSADTAVSSHHTEVASDPFFAKDDHSEQDEFNETELPQSNPIISAQGPDPEVQRIEPTEVDFQSQFPKPECHRVVDLKDPQMPVDIEEEAWVAITQTEPVLSPEDRREEPAAADPPAEMLLPPAELYEMHPLAVKETERDLLPAAWEAALPPTNIKVETDLPLAGIDKELEIENTEAETQMLPAEVSCGQDANLARMINIVHGMLPDDQLPARIERIVAKMIKQAKLADTVRRIFNQAVEGL